MRATGGRCYRPPTDWLNQRQRQLFLTATLRQDERISLLRSPPTLLFLLFPLKTSRHAQVEAPFPLTVIVLLLRATYCT